MDHLKAQQTGVNIAVGDWENGSGFAVTAADGASRYRGYGNPEAGDGSEEFC
jgi:hypothetical protein